MIAMDQISDTAPGPSATAHVEEVEGRTLAPLDGREALRMEAALDYLAAHVQNQPSLGEIARHVGLSEYHFQRLFSRWVGISPKRFLQYLTLGEAKRVLAESASVLDAAYEAGLSGPGRLHDLFVTYEAMTPGEYKLKGHGLEIRYGFHPSPFGECLLMVTERGVCGLGFVVQGDRAGTLAELRRDWAAARFIADQPGTASFAARIFRGDKSGEAAERGPLKLLLRGTPFQLKVWEALLTVPPGCLTSYADIARRLGYPEGGQVARAVGRANATNTISYLIPCHRVIQKSGLVSGYRWGTGRKLAMIGWEVAQAAPAGRKAAAPA